MTEAASLIVPVGVLDPTVSLVPIPSLQQPVDEATHPASRAPGPAWLVDDVPASGSASRAAVGGPASSAI